MTIPPSRTETSNVRVGDATRGPRSIGKIEKAKDPRSTLKRLLPYLGRFKVGLVAVLVFVLIYTVLGLIGSLSDGGGDRPVYQRQRHLRLGQDRPVDAGSLRFQ